MGALSDLLAGPPPKQGPPCSVARAIDDVTDPDDQLALLVALEADGVGAGFIQKALAGAGVVPPPDGQIRRHRAGVCKCRGREWQGMTGRRDG